MAYWQPVRTMPFVGRSNELELLGEAWTSALDGVPRTVVVRGRSGAGKSRLLSEFSTIVQAASGRWLLGTCPSQEAARQPYLPVVAALRRWTRSQSSSLGSDLPELARATLSGLLPELNGNNVQMRTAVEQDREPAVLFEASLLLVESMAAAHPIALVLDDLHWADSLSLRLVEWVLRNLEGGRILTILAYRSEDVRDFHPLHPIVSEIQCLPAVDVLDLDRNPLTEADIGIVAEARLGRPPTTAELLAITRRSGGLPFFVQELAGVIEQGDALPSRLETLLEKRIAAIPVSLRPTLEALAVGLALGPVSERLLQTATDLESEALRRQMGAAVAEGILETTTDGYTFSQDLLREAVVARQLPGDRADRHAAFARALEHSGDLLDPTVLSRLARHWCESQDKLRAASASYAAGRASQGAFAYSSAARHFQDALRYWHLLSEPLASERPRSEVVRRIVECLLLSGDHEEAVGVVEVELARSEGCMSEHFGLIAILGRLLRALGRLEDSTDILRAALEHSEVAPEPSVVLVACELATDLALKQRIDEARPLVADVLDAARQIGDDMTIGRALGAFGLLLINQGDPSGIAVLDQAMAAARRADDIDGLFRCYNNFSDAYRQAGRYGDAVALAAESVRFSGRLGVRTSVGVFARANEAEALVAMGRAIEGLEAVGPRMRALRTDSDAHAALTRCWALLRLGRVADAEEEMLVATAWLSRAPDHHLQGACIRNQAELAWLRDCNGDLRQAVDRCLDRERAHRVPQYSAQVCAIGIRSEVDTALAGRQGSGSARRRCLSLVRRAKELEGMALASMPAPLATALATAELSRLDGGDEATAGWDAVAEMATRWQDQYHHAYAHWRRSEVLLGAGHVDAARCGASEALELASAIGADHLVSRLVLVLESTPLPGRRTSDETGGSGSPEAGFTASSGWAPAEWSLTRREVEVLALLTEGLTNGQIASELYIARKTASVHVSNILAKLGAQTRTEAAAMAVRARSVAAL